MSVEQAVIDPARAPEFEPASGRDLGLARLLRRKEKVV
jgi:hypothetical protein